LLAVLHDIISFLNIAEQQQQQQPQSQPQPQQQQHQQRQQQQLSSHSKSTEEKLKPAPPPQLQVTLPSITVPPNAFKLELDKVDSMAQEILNKVKNEINQSNGNFLLIFWTVKEVFLFTLNDLSIHE
jgi:hypothetical protein